MSDVTPATPAKIPDQAEPSPGTKPIETVKPFRTVGVVGAGRMGAQIAQWLALHGCGVILCDTDRQAIEHGVAVLRELFADGVRRGVLSPAEAHKLTGGIGITTSLEDFEICDLVVEAINEDLAAKQKVFAELARRVDADCVLASTSEGLALADIGAQMTGLDRLVGFKFTLPITTGARWEIIRHPQTNPITINRIAALSQALTLVMQVR